MPRGYPNYHNFLLIFLWLAGVQTLLTKCNVAELGIRSFQKNVPFFSFFSERKQKRTERSFFKMEKNGKNGSFFYKERKRRERTERSFEKNGVPNSASWQQYQHDFLPSSIDVAGATSTATATCDF